MTATQCAPVVMKIPGKEVVKQGGANIVGWYNLRDNWLPVPSGQFTVTFRTYWPSEPIALETQTWRMVPVEPVN